MKVLVIGLGSIGQRHVRNIRARFGTAIDILAYRVRGDSRVITEQMGIGGHDVEGHYGVRRFQHLRDALAEQPHAAFICNPTSMHVATALECAQAGCHLFIEKPLSDSMTGVEQLAQLVAARGVAATVGYQQRFHPALVRVRELLDDGAIGRINEVHAEFGEYLPDAHPYEDYRESYAARAALGGGVILCYSHEVDYLCWLFGQPTSIDTTVGRSGQLEIDVEDTAHSTFRFEWRGAPFEARLKLSFLTRPAKRSCFIVGDRGSIALDLIAPELVIATPAGTRRDEFEGFRRNQLFEAELDHFIGATSGSHPPAVSLADAIRSLGVALAMRDCLAAVPR
ncbi:MAG TPA: Gfo/Idh/MocA family oxidoreductase [Vicinamibacterales bacterium]|nr:Gfo/Idh/MocA family oxidoreductase [Vicinamibacterales bacterium]